MRAGLNAMLFGSGTMHMRDEGGARSPAILHVDIDSRAHVVCISRCRRA